MWTHYAEESSLAALLEHLSLHDQVWSGRSLALLNQLLSSLESSVKRLSSTFFSTRLPTLLSLMKSVPNSPILEALVDHALDVSLPPFFNGLPGSADTFRNLAKEVIMNQQPPSFRLGRGVDLRVLLDSHSWTEHTVSIITKLVYVDHTTRSSVKLWLCANAGDHAHRASYLASITHALLDSHVDLSWLDADKLALGRVFTRFIRELAEGCSSSDASLYMSCVSMLPNLPSPIVQHIIACMQQEYEHLDMRPFNKDMFRVSRLLTRQPPSLSVEFIEVLIDSGLSWVLTSLSNDLIADVHEAVPGVIALLELAVCDIKPHLVEPLLLAIVQDHTDDPVALSLAGRLVSSTRLKVSVYES